MKENGLMLGDWVQTPDGPNQVYKILDNEIWVGDFKASARLFEGQFHPIPLTPEILEKNGFKDAGFYSELLWNDAFQIISDCASLSIRCKNSDLSLSIPCDMVHELQHALRLCGIEKEIII